MLKTFWVNQEEILKNFEETTGEFWSNTEMTLNEIFQKFGDNVYKIVRILG